MKFILSLFFVSILISSCSNDQTKKTSYREFFNRSVINNNLMDTNVRNQRAMDHFIIGSSLVQQEKLSDAIVEFQESLRYDTTSATYFALGETYFKLSKNDLALDYILLSIDSNPDFIQPYEILAEIFMVKNEIDNAIAAVEISVKKDPSLNNKLFLAHLLANQDQERAIKLYEEIYKTKRSDIILMRLMDLYKRTGKFKKLELVLQESYIENSGNKNTFEELFSSYIQSKKYQEAFELLKIASNNFVLDQLQTHYAILLQEMIDDKNFNDLSLAKSYIKHVEKKFFYYWKMVYGTSFLAKKFQLTDQVEKTYDHVLLIYDSDPNVPLYIASYYSIDKNFEKSNEILKSERNNFPENSSFDLILAQNYHEQDKRDSAIYYTKTAFEKAPKNSELCSQLAFYYEHDKVYTKSDSLYKLSIELNPNNIAAMNNYAYSLVTRSIRLDECKQMIEKVISIDSTKATFLDTYAWILYKHGEYEKALVYINKSIELDNENAEVYDHLGDIHVKLKDFKSAIKAYQRCLEIDPSRTIIYEKIKSIR